MHSTLLRQLVALSLSGFTLLVAGGLAHAQDRDDDDRGRNSGRSFERDDRDDDDRGSEVDRDDDSSNRGRGGDDDDADDDRSGSNSGSDDDDDSEGDDDDARDGDDDDGVDGGRDGFSDLDRDPAGRLYQAREIVVQAPDDQLRRRLRREGFEIVRVRPLRGAGGDLLTVRAPRGVSLPEALERIAALAPTAATGRNYLYQTSAGAAHLPQVGAAPSKAPRRGRSQSAEAIAVVDGFSARFGRSAPVVRLVGKSADTTHGDDVVRILTKTLGDNSKTAAAPLLLVDVVEKTQAGPAANADALIAALDMLLVQKVPLINVSLAGPDHPALATTITALDRAGVTIVAAVGNQGPAAPPLFPAAYPGVIGVTAVDGRDAPYVFAGRGAHVDVAAPGVDVDVNGARRSGTSFAAPQVTAILAAQGKGAASGSAAALRLLRQQARDAGPPGADQIYGVGIVRPQMSVAKAQN